MPADVASAAVDELRQAVAALRDALGGPAAPVMLQLRKLEQRITRLEDLAAATPAHPNPAPAVREPVQSPLAAAIDRALEEDQRRSEKADATAQKLARVGVWVESNRFMATADNPYVGMIGDVDSGGPLTVVHVVEGGKSPALAPSLLFAQLPDDKARRLVLRDVHRSWFQRGVPGLGTSPPEVADAIRAALAEHEEVPVMFIGTGFAGFGAILLGALVNAALIIAIDAPTSVDPQMLKALGDDRWDEDLAVLEARQASSGEHLDLLSVLRGKPAVSVEVHYTEADPLQRGHAERLGGLENVRLRPHDVEGSLVSHLTEGRALAKLVRRAVGSRKGRENGQGPDDPSSEHVKRSSQA